MANIDQYISSGAKESKYGVIFIFYRKITIMVGDVTESPEGVIYI